MEGYGKMVILFFNIGNVGETYFSKICGIQYIYKIWIIIACYFDTTVENI